MIYQKLKSLVGNTGKIEEEYGGFEITVTDDENFPWKDVFLSLIDSGFQIWINKTDFHLQIMSKPEVG